MKPRGGSIGPNTDQSEASKFQEERWFPRYLHKVFRNKASSNSPRSSRLSIRIAMAGTISAALFAAALTTGVHAMSHAKAWSNVYINGRFAGLVPNRRAVIDTIERIAVGYNVDVRLVPVFKAVDSRYNWERVAALPTPAVAIQLNGKSLLYTNSLKSAHEILSRVRQALLPKHVQSDAAVAFVGHVTLQHRVVGVSNILSPAAAVHQLLAPKATNMAARGEGLNAILVSKRSSDGVTPSTRRTSLTATTNRSAAIMEKSGGVAPAREASPVRATQPELQLEVRETVHKTLCIPAPVHYVNNSKLPSSVTKVIHRGRSGVVKESVLVHFVNGSQTQQTVLTKKVARSAQPEIVERGTNTGVADGNWVWPSTCYDITSPFGPRVLGGVAGFHPGIDIGCPIGTPVYATNNGVVQEAGWNSGGYGNWVLINNGNGIETVFGHMSRVVAHAGETVSKGQLIGYSGDTGNVTGPHLHYEVRLNGKAIPPTPYM